MEKETRETQITMTREDFLEILGFSALNFIGVVTTSIIVAVIHLATS